jgi:hypothetical protein
MQRSLTRKILLVFLIAGLYIFLGYSKILFLRPQSIHQWAQCDRGSVAVNYLHNGFDFFHPQTHNISNGTGITGLEFPILNYTAAIGYFIFGYHEYIYRLIIFLLLLYGLIMAFQISDRNIPNKILSPLPVILLASSPVLAYYGITFLPDAASLGLSLAAWNIFLKYLDNNSKKIPVSLILLCTVASLIKISSLINPFIMAWYLLINNRGDGYYKRIKQVIPFCAIVIALIGWYAYASWLNTNYQAKIFMLEIRPVSSLEEFKTIWNEIVSLWLWRFYPPVYFITLTTASIVAIFFYNSDDKKLLQITLLLYASSLFFFLLMFTQFRIHDYYIIPLMPAFFFHWILISRIFAKKRNIITYFFILLTAMVTAFTVSDAKEHLRTAYDKQSWKYGSRTFDLYFYAEPELRKLKIKPADGVISIFDQSFNISLYLMNQKGITIGPLTPTDTIVNIIKRSQLPYAILNNFNPQRFEPVMDSLQLGKRIYEWNDLTVYRLNNSN